MTKTQTTKRSLLISVMSLMLCFAMLAGTTFAWFKKEITTANNIVKSADYKVSLQCADAFSGDYADLDESSVLFDDVTLSPGASTSVKYIKVTNNNNYAVKASVSIGEVTTEGGTNQMNLLTATNVDAAKEITDLTASKLKTAKVLDNVEIAAGGSAVVAVAVQLPDTADVPNVSNSFTITVGATQQTT